MIKLCYKEESLEKIIWHIFGMKISHKKKSVKKNNINNDFPITLEYLFMNNPNFGRKEKEWYISKRCYELLGYYPNLKNPKTFNEKIQWLNLNYFNPIEELCNDKADFKEYIKEKLGDGYTAKLLGIYESVNDINFDSLPKSFVLKNTLTGDDKGVKIIKNKNNLNIDKFKYELNNLVQNWTSGYYVSLNRNSNRNVRLIIEEYLGDLNDNLDDYKFMCFNGKFQFGYIDVRIPNERGKIYYFDTDWNLLPIKHMDHISSNSFFPKKPKNFHKMIEIAEKLAKDFPFVRVDFYNINGKIYLGELTFNPDGGFGKFNDDWDLKIGQLLDLSKIDDKYLITQEAKTLVAVERERE